VQIDDSAPAGSASGQKTVNGHRNSRDVALAPCVVRSPSFERRTSFSLGTYPQLETGQFAEIEPSGPPGLW
jgi:hypothetical protein